MSGKDGGRCAVVFLFIAWVGIVFGNEACADVIINNGSNGTSYTGWWEISGGLVPYGLDSLWSRDGSTYSWQMSSQPSGTYEVLMWWSQWPSRGTSIPVEISHDQGTSSLIVDQSVHAGQWNSLGTYSFAGKGKVTLTAANGSTVSTCADAVWFRLLSGSNPSEYIADNGDAATSSTGTWEVSGGAYPYGRDSYWSRDGATYTWTFQPLETGTYDLSMWWTEWASRSTSVPVDVEHTGGRSRVYVNQLKNAGQWNSLGMYTFEAGGSYDITLTASPGPASTCADAVQLTFLFNSGQSVVSITFPADYHLQVDHDLTVKAEARDLQSGWGVRFVLDAGTTGERMMLDYSAPYEATFNDLSLSEHALDALIVDANNLEIVGISTHDGVTRIGIGDYFVAFGNSITEGYGDDAARDNTSLDGRNWGGGYEPILNNLLTTVKGYPHTVVNEGMGGTLSEDGAAIIHDVLASHPGAQAYLLQYGTNDSASWHSVPSGLGLLPGDYGYDGSYKDSMQQIINAIQGAGKEVYLAKIPIVLGESSTSIPFADPESAIRNQFVREYNYVVDELVLANHIAVSPPDFYAYFTDYDSSETYRYETEFFDNLHPNGLGYQSMAELWLASLTQSIVSIIDNGDAVTSSTGTWEVSGGAYPYGRDSYWSRDGDTYTWTFQPPETGSYDLAMWWTEWASRSTSVPVDIEYAGGSTRVDVNQLKNAGQWNSLGQYTFAAGENYKITITAQPGPASTCADALRFILLSAW